jgi:hypothetical protein
LVPLPTKRATRKKTIVVMMKRKDGEGKKARKIWVSGEIFNFDCTTRKIGV